MNNHDKTEDEQGILTFSAHWFFIIEEDSIDVLLSHIGNITNALVIKTTSKVHLIIDFIKMIARS